MKKVNDFIRENIYKQKGLLDPETKSFNELKFTERFSELDLMCKCNNRMIMGAYRYGKLYSKEKVLYLSIEDLKLRLQLYIDTGNMEHLIDLINYAKLAFMFCIHPNSHFKFTDDKIHSVNY